MKVYTFFTNTHKIFLDYFINSFPFEENLDLEIRFLSQDCVDGKFHSDGWNTTMMKKVQYIIDSLYETSNDDLFIHSDIDVQFFGKIKNDLEILMNKNNFDILFQNDGNQVCMGFFVCKSNQTTKNFFKKVYDNLHNHKNDQYAVNYYIRNFNINWGVLPDRYFSIGVKNSLWLGEPKTFILPENIIMHHANFTVGVENKIKLLNIIKDQIK